MRIDAKTSVFHLVFNCFNKRTTTFNPKAFPFPLWINRETIYLGLSVLSLVPALTTI